MFSSWKQKNVKENIIPELKKKKTKKDNVAVHNQFIVSSINAIGLHKEQSLIIATTDYFLVYLFIFFQIKSQCDNFLIHWLVRIQLCKDKENENQIIYYSNKFCSEKKVKIIPTPLSNYVRFCARMLHFHCMFPSPKR